MCYGFSAIPHSQTTILASVPKMDNPQSSCSWVNSAGSVTPKNLATLPKSFTILGPCSTVIGSGLSTVN